MGSSGPLTSDSGVASPAITAVFMTAPSTPLTSASTSTSTTVVSSVSMSTSITSSPATGMSVTWSSSVISSPGSTVMIVKLFEAQSQLTAAQVQAATLPPLVSFDRQCEGDEMEFEQ